MGILSIFMQQVSAIQSPEKATTPEPVPQNTDSNVVPQGDEYSASLENFFQTAIPRMDESGDPKQVQLFPTPVQVRATESGSEFTILLNQYSYPKSQISIQQLLASASAEDSIKVVVSNVGGFIYSTLALASMLQACKAKTIGVFSAVDSIEAIIVWLSCKDKQVASMPCMFIEGIKYGNQGAATDQFMDSKNTLIMQADLLSTVVSAGVLTREEAENLSKKDSALSLFGEELKERLSSVIEQSKQ